MPGGASCSACSGTPRPTRRAAVSAALVARAARVAPRRRALSRPTRRRPTRGHILPPRAAVEGDPSNRLGDGRGGHRRAAAAQARERAAARRCRRSPSPRRSGWRSPCGARRARDVAVCALQMWAYVAAYKTPHDDAEAQRARVHVAYPIVADRVLGLGELPTVRLQRALARVGHRRPGVARRSTACSCGRTGAGSRSRTAPLPTCCVRAPERFPRAAALTYAVFDIGAMRLLGRCRPRRPGTPARARSRADGRRSRAAHDGRVRRGLLA